MGTYIKQQNFSLVLKFQGSRCVYPGFSELLAKALLISSSSHQSASKQLQSLPYGWIMQFWSALATGSCWLECTGSCRSALVALGRAGWSALGSAGWSALGRAGAHWVVLDAWSALGRAGARRALGRAGAHWSCWMPGAHLVVLNEALWVVPHA